MIGKVRISLEYRIAGLAGYQSYLSFQVPSSVTTLMSEENRGGAKVGDNLEMTGEFLGVPKGTDTTLGVVKGSADVSINENGEIIINPSLIQRLLNRDDI